MTLLQALVIGLTGLILTPGYTFYFDVTPKLVILLVGTAALMAVSAFRFRGAPKPLTVVVLLTLASLGISTAASVNPALSLYGTTWRRFGALPQAALLAFAWMVAAQTAGRPDRVRTILRGVAISAALAAAYGICQYAGWDPLLNAAAYHIGEGIWTIVRPPGTLGYVSYFASWLLLAGFLCLALADSDTSPRWRLFAYLAAALSLTTMLLTGTRAAMVGLAAGAAAWTFARGSLRISRRGAAIGAIGLLIAAAFWFSPAGWPLRSRARWFTEDPWGGARPLLWKDSLRMALRHPALGFGPDTFQGEFTSYESPALAQAYPDFMHESPHNLFLDSLIGQGVPGLALLALFCCLGLRRSRPWLTAGVAAAIVCQQFGVLTLPTALLLYTAIALSVAADYPEPQLRRWSPPALVALAAAACLIWAAIRFGGADRELALTQRDLASQNLDASSAHYASYARLEPGPTSSDLWYARALLNDAARESSPAARFRAITLSATAADRATHTAEDPFNAWYNLAILWAGQNNAGETERALRSAIAARPQWFKPHWTLARLLAAQSRYEEGEREAELAAYLSGGKHSEVLQTLTAIQGLRAAASRLQK